MVWLFGFDTAFYANDNEEGHVDHPSGKDIPCAGWLPLEIEKVGNVVFRL